MITTLGSVFSSTCDKYSSVICLNRAESDWDIKIDIQDFSLLSLVVHVVKCDDFLIKLEEMNFVCPNHFNFLLILICLRPINHSDTSLGKIIGHS